MSSEKPVIFISCGQSNDQERKLGQRVRELVEATGVFQGYFAENQSSAQSVTKNIFVQLHNSFGLVCIMHERGNVSSPSGTTSTRGSVWIEQEIAIVAFLTEVLNYDIQTRVYLKKGINREGVRDKILINPKDFETDDEVLIDLQTVVQGWAQEQSRTIGIRSTQALQQLLEELCDNGRLLAKELSNNRPCSDQSFQELKRGQILNQFDPQLKDIIKEAYEDVADYNSCLQTLPSISDITMARSNYIHSQLSPAKTKAIRSVGHAISALDSLLNKLSRSKLQSHANPTN